MGKACLTALFHRTRSEDLTRLAKQFPWDHPIARTLDHEAHRRKMAGKSCRFFSWTGLGSLPSLIHFFSICRRVSRSRVSTARPVAYPPLPLPSTISIELGRALLGPKMFVSLFFLDCLSTLEAQPVCHIFQWVTHPTHGSVCNHCARMMDGFTLDDLISGSGECSLTEDDVVAYVRGGDPTERDWDDWPLRMTYLINAFLRANPDHPESDLDILNAF